MKAHGLLHQRLPAEMTGVDPAGRAAVVTGGAAGIGLAIARRLTAAGVALYLWDQRAARWPPSSATSRRRRRRPSRRRSARRWRRPRRHFGRVDSWSTMPASSGRWRRSGSTPADFRRVLASISAASSSCCPAVVPPMLRGRAAPPGRIVNIARSRARRAWRCPAPMAHPKPASRADQVAGQGAGRRGHPGQLLAPAAAETAMAQELTPERRADIDGRIPMGRFARRRTRSPRWPCGCSRRTCSFSTGAVFDLSGGRATY